MPLIHKGNSAIRIVATLPKLLLGLFPGGGGGYSHILAIRLCAAGKGMVFKPFGLTLVAASVIRKI